MSTSARLRFVFDVEPDGREPFRVVAGPRDVSLWERTGKGRSLGAIERDARMGQLEEIAYTACQRQRGEDGAPLWSGTLGEFRESCDVHPIDESDDDEDDEAGPT